MSNEADTRRRFVVPRLQAAGWENDPHRISNTFLRIQSAYVWTVRQLVRVPLIVLALTVPLILLTAWSFSKLPSGFLPADDQGYGIVVVQLPNAASLERTRVATDEVSKVLAKTPGVETLMTLGGYSLLDGANAPNTATLFVMFAPFDARKGLADLSQQAILGSLNNDFRLIRDANAFAIAPLRLSVLALLGDSNCRSKIERVLVSPRCRVRRVACWIRSVALRDW